MAKFNRLQSKNIVGVSDAVLARLIGHEYPGNVRELENIIEQAFVLCRGGLIEMEHLPVELRPQVVSPAGGPTSLEAMERRLIGDALERSKGNRKRAARELGIDPSTLYRKLKALGLQPPAADGRYRRQ